MRSILESLCFGTVTGMSFSLPEDRTNKEISCYDRIKELLKEDEDNAALLEEYAETVTVNYESLILRAYKQAFATAFALAAEIFDAEAEKEREKES